MTENTETNSTRKLAAFSLEKWIEENRQFLKPPVGNRLLYSGEFKVMIVCGPNYRTDYHIECGEEFFYQLSGTLVVKVVHEGKFYEVPVREGDTFCLPAGVPHSPQREAGSIGLVVERQRKPEEKDQLRWYCQNCQHVLYEESFHCVDLVKDLPPIIERYYGNESVRTCRNCGWLEQPPQY
ncbi:3-hydroxyanthranilate 3,4-dioxygenase [Galdieria sulphuraria]|uniref:3-hydroxyanthranilate 3,4-dioxygenase n=1 Tax=Galdieria sulphuraria TaxID=130081 RepID=M2Y1T6_GALSU|nr:3-hydroxyanthranilate 3,4 dioxygenase [Galdieria sulphuraria]EME29893.1 3-hydroxyanthranilate 3,4 dioxygenase [Galdieria sulphuraria]GJD11941.1 3-hydroxyanthranilate 3,4-dioxygenase [Galdieria sulphuraria]|eukprot:XP_005706413.1 3-hydroxyanthranilate 3,4 dioxygenase [Galdieria sulphuraria]